MMMMKDFGIVGGVRWWVALCLLTCASIADDVKKIRCDLLDEVRNSRINCSASGEVSCFEGWTGDLCNTAVCREGCHPVHGYCTQPGECKCALGWRGKDCDECVPLPGCKHGFCTTTSYECICEPGWEGNYCSIPVCREGCHSSRGYCKFPDECRCRIGWGGETCDECKPLPGCLNGYCTKPLECRCREGWMGLLCDTPICRENCSNVHGFCVKPGECRCEVGWWGDNCDTCFPYPGCKHGTCDEPWQCNCKDGWKGLLCDLRNKTGESFCEKNPDKCLNGGTCINIPGERRYACSCPSLFTGKHCDYLAYSRASIFPIFSRGSYVLRSAVTTTEPPKTSTFSSNSTTNITTTSTTTELSASTSTTTTFAPSITSNASTEVSNSTKEGLGEPRGLPVSYSVSTSVSISTSSSPSAQTEEEHSSSPKPEEITSQETTQMVSPKEGKEEEPVTERQRLYGEKNGLSPVTVDRPLRFEADGISLNSKRKYIGRKSQRKSSSNLGKENGFPVRRRGEFYSGRRVASSRISNKPRIVKPQPPIIVLDINEPDLDFEDSTVEDPITNTDANSPQANQITRKNRFLRHHPPELSSSSKERGSYQPFFPLRGVRLVTQENPPKPSNLRISQYIFNDELDSFPQESSHVGESFQSIATELSSLPTQTRINRRTGILPSTTSSVLPSLGRFSSHDDHELVEATDAKELKNKAKKEDAPISYYEEHYNGRVHIGDVTEVDKHAPFEEIVDAFIELKKLTS